MQTKQDSFLNTALALLRLGGECFGQHNLLSTASDAERREALERFFQWWNGRVVPFLQTAEKRQTLPFKIQAGYRVWSAVPQRALSPEVDYGVNWGLLSPRDWPRWRVSFILSTAEVYAVELNGLDHFAVLGQVEPTREAAEAALQGWADGEMTLVSLAGRFQPVEVDDPVAEAADKLKRCGGALRRIRLACDQAEKGGNVAETLAFINAQLREAGFLSGDEDPSTE
jgi:hypothetical protein